MAIASPPNDAEWTPEFESRFSGSKLSAIFAFGAKEGDREGENGERWSRNDCFVDGAKEGIDAGVN